MAYGKSGKDSQLAALSDQSELDLPDRRALDEAVLELLGVTDRKERAALMERLYGYLREFFEQVRAKEEKAIANKHRAKRRAAASPAELAAQVLAELKDKHPSLLRGYADFLDLDQPFSTFDLPDGGVPELHHDLFANTGSVRFMRGKKQVGLVCPPTPRNKRPCWPWWRGKVCAAWCGRRWMGPTVRGCRRGSRRSWRTGSSASGC